MTRASLTGRLTAFFASGAPCDPTSALHADVRRFIGSLIGAAAAEPLLTASDSTPLVNLLSGFTPISEEAAEAKGELVLVANYWRRFCAWQAENFDALEPSKKSAPEPSEAKRRTAAPSPRSDSATTKERSGEIVVPIFVDGAQGRGRMCSADGSSDERRAAMIEALSRGLPAGGAVDRSRLEALGVRYPWFAEAIDAYREAAELVELFRAKDYRPPATLLVGPPGIGKSSFAAVLAEALGRGAFAQPMAALSEGMTIVGSNPVYSGAQASLPVRAFLETGQADPMIVLDEIDKTGTSAHHGQALDALLPLLEPTTAGNFRDAFLDRAVDASRIGWIATANSVSDLPLALSSRLRVIVCREPGRDDLDAIVAGFREQFARELGAPADAVPELDEVLRARLLAALKHSGDIRKLRRIWRGEIIARKRGGAMRLEAVVSGEEV
ncbi:MULTISPECIES: AAA family ATPase [Methylosinus]|uniref:AAA+ ATPase domain-containing protein n=1 Tax=Methylosinus trichosporium (strain ATCC 35070 / NCIMB 11131 / UNIQEM 75 / OB3b) TaxID=595536 RepID=A0A2D2D1H9_METT3|nr:MULTISPECIES: AAA family ATPase [Methylosinus]ATQ68853.1 hypothetical protein CQW49_13895 [Methylosinus trichosporium OB3b]OBS52039.1 hypothetical protein A8B73_13095 [Methylosinus sp. 3S-1]